MNDVKALRKKLEKLGLECVRTANGHFKVYRDGKFVEVIAGNPTSRRSLLNAKVSLRKAGIAV